MVVWWVRSVLALLSMRVPSKGGKVAAGVEGVSGRMPVSEEQGALGSGLHPWDQACSSQRQGQGFDRESYCLGDYRHGTGVRTCEDSCGAVAVRDAATALQQEGACACMQGVHCKSIVSLKGPTDGSFDSKKKIKTNHDTGREENILTRGSRPDA